MVISWSDGLSSNMARKEGKGCSIMKIRMRHGRNGKLVGFGGRGKAS